MWILGISLLLLAVLKTHEVRSLQPFFRGEKSIKLSSFSQVKNSLTSNDQELLELWESMLTGRSAPLNKWIKQKYQHLGLSHIFTPSGFHLSALLTPVSKLLPQKRWQLSLLLLIGLALAFLPGQWALKRMVLIKSLQKLTGLRIGFASALLLDILLGSFQHAPLSFTYSFLFLGIIYSGLQGAGLVIWFFIAQSLICFFQLQELSPLLLILSPILNLAFAAALPILVIMAIPMWQWQLELGLMLLRGLQGAVDCAVWLVQHFPSMEIHMGVLFIFALFVFKRFALITASLLLLSNSLNLDLTKVPGAGSYDFYPQGQLIRIISTEKEDKIYFSDGRCSRKLIRGMWWEKCSPVIRRSRNKKIKKLSSLSLKTRKFFLHG